MTAETIEKIEEMADIKTVVVNDHVYADRELHFIPENLLATPLELSTLNALVEYIKNNKQELSSKMIIAIESPQVVKLLSELNDDSQRECLAVVKAQIPTISFDYFMEREEFNIMLQSQFVSDDLDDEIKDDRSVLLKCISGVKSGTLSEYGDDGCTQKAVVKTGVASLQEAIVPNPVALRPFRTFSEIEQPLSLFVFRMHDDRDSVRCALFEADGGAWKLDAINEIHNYLKEKLADNPEISILA